MILGPRFLGLENREYLTRVSSEYIISRAPLSLRSTVPLWTSRVFLAYVMPASLALYIACWPAWDCSATNLKFGRYTVLSSSWSVETCCYWGRELVLDSISMIFWRRHQCVHIVLTTFYHMHHCTMQLLGIWSSVHYYTELDAGAAGSVSGEHFL